jgi:phosphohistidine phosphatase SixA
MRNSLMLVFALIVASTATQVAVAADRVYVMRHLQKSDGADPPLSAEGAANAQQLARLLAGRGIKAVFATPTRRAMQTAEPLAAKLGISVTSYNPTDPAALVNAVGAIRGAVLIVGHSNTVPDLVARFGGKQPVILSEQDYGTVFVVNRDTGAITEIKVHPAR